MDPQLIDTEQQPQLEQKSKRGLYLEILIEAAIVLIVVGGLIGAFSYFHIISLPSFLSKQSNIAIRPTPTPLPVQPLALPLSPYLSILDDVTVRYNGKTTVASITPLDGNAIIQLNNLQQPGLVFNVDEKTRVTKATAVTKQISVNEIKQGNEVSFSLTYSLTQKTWTLTSLVLLNQ